jgi:DNA-binding NarL/FixJ family response regulator
MRELFVQKREKVSLLYANQEAKNILKKYSLNKLIDKLEDRQLSYLKMSSESYYVRKVGSLDSSHMQLIVMHKFPHHINFKQIFQEFSFTSRQQEVALLAATGNSNSQIAKKLFITEYTVKDHLKEIFLVLSIHNRSELLPKLLKLR